VGGKMNNEYKIVDDYVVIYLKPKDGHSMEFIIDMSDFNLVNSHEGSWIAAWHVNVKDYYVKANVRKSNGRKTTITLQSFLVSAKNKLIDHIDHDTMNNRRSNLRVSDASTNSMNRKAKNSNNTSGYRNVCWNGNKWIVQLQINKKNKVLGKFDDVDEAGLFAKEMRIKHYGKFRGSE
jgi:hypothetical protein